MKLVFLSHRNGRSLGTYSGPVAMASKFFGLPGEKLLTWSPGGVLRVRADPAARDKAA